jgi:hypothetical protein
MTQSLVAADFDRCVLPLFVPDPDRPDRPTRLGSCVLVQLFGVHFLVTAAHVLRRTDGQPLFVGRQANKLIGLPGLLGYSIEDLDIGLSPLDSGELARLDGLIFVPETSMESESPPPRHGGPINDYVVFGYPESNSQFRVEQPRRNVRQHSFTLHTAITSRNIAAEKLDPRVHLVLEFDRENIFVQGKRLNPPNPHGISGGAAFHDVGGELKLAGIMTEYRRNSCILVGTQMTEVIAFAQHVIQSTGLGVRP